MQFTHIAGIDEAGRGPLAGPVSVGVVCVPANFDMKLLENVRDSKKISAKKREALYEVLTRLEGLVWSVKMIRAQVIDTKGIMFAVRTTLSNALADTGADPETSLIQLDGGLAAPVEFQHQETIVRGDATNKLIGAASILAKVTRDRYMLERHKQYPEYGFDQHKGYGTKKHKEAIRTFGLTTLHRKTFCH